MSTAASDLPDTSGRNAPLRFITAASLFDGHDAAINIMRRLIQARGAEVVHLGHNRRLRCQHLGPAVGQVVGRAVEGPQGLARGSVLVEHALQAARAVDEAGAQCARCGEQGVAQDGAEDLQGGGSQRQPVTARVEVVARLLEGLRREAMAVAKPSDRAAARAPYLFDVLAQTRALEQPKRGRVREELEPARAQGQDHPRLVRREELVQSS